MDKQNIPIKIKVILTLSLIGIMCVFSSQFSLSSKSRDIFSAVDNNDVKYVERWLSRGGNPNAQNERGESLLYIATGPHGGHQVLLLLLKAKANPNQGHARARYTPLMNASSWVDLEAVDLLLQYGADPDLENADGKTAYGTTGLAGGSEVAVRERLLKVMKKPKSTKDSDASSD